MKTKLITFSTLLLIVLSSSPCFGAIVHLNSGESLSGRIQKMDEQIVFLESDRGFGILQIERADVRLIEFDSFRPDLTRKFGLGFYQRGVALTGEGNNQEYNLGAMSFKNWLNALDAMELLLGYSETKGGGQNLLSIFSLEIRFVRTFLQEGNHQLYWAAGVGHLNVNDEFSDITTTGTRLNAAIGIEMFQLTYPNIGISTEIGITNQNIGRRKSLSIGLPSISVRYYF
ncbi:hypothetical protein WDW89_15330 [Deltaproteobacteria bacterium TL4]